MMSSSLTLDHAQDVVGADHLTRLRQTDAIALVWGRHLGGERSHLPLPLGKAAVEQGNGRVAQPAQQPPHAHGHGAEAIVVDDDLFVHPHPPVIELVGQHVGVGQGVTAGLAGDDGPGQVFVEMNIARPRNVGLRVGAPPSLRISQGEPAVEDDPVRVFEMPRQILGGNQCIDIHGGRGDQASTAASP
jgi:hypothetical protein